MTSPGSAVLNLVVINSIPSVITCLEHSLKALPLIRRGIAEVTAGCLSNTVLLASFSLASHPDITIVPFLWNDFPHVMDDTLSSSGQTIMESLSVLSTVPAAGQGVRDTEMHEIQRLAVQK